MPRRRRPGPLSWIVRIATLVVVGVVVWFAFDRMPFSTTTGPRPVFYDHDGYEGRPDSPLDAGKVDALAQRARGQGFN